ncbi:hypothetical protein OH802_06495 [Nocardioides sp. NBC_00850]|uniref:hypothetical protein n=1 Tax=Nocardioides sp. NBC_00850 TaxID=2976001 RepID=UPI003867843F|nr:hypothetical protein OH802_06495 [Nocardioides sp. NBC_00850]
MTSPDPLVEAARLYDEYVDVAQISTLTELARATEAVPAEPRWYGAPPAGLVLCD